MKRFIFIAACSMMLGLSGIALSSTPAEAGWFLNMIRGIFSGYSDLPWDSDNAARGMGSYNAPLGCYRMPNNRLLCPDG